MTVHINKCVNNTLYVDTQYGIKRIVSAVLDHSVCVGVYAVSDANWPKTTLKTTTTCIQHLSNNHEFQYKDEGWTFSSNKVM